MLMLFLLNNAVQATISCHFRQCKQRLLIFHCLIATLNMGKPDITADIINITGSVMLADLSRFNVLLFGTHLKALLRLSFACYYCLLPVTIVFCLLLLSSASLLQFSRKDQTQVPTLFTAAAEMQ